MGFVWFLEQTAIVSGNSANQLIFVVLCFLWGVDRILKYYLDNFRFQRIKRNVVPVFLNLANFSILQTLNVWIVSLPWGSYFAYFLYRTPVGVTLQVTPVHVETLELDPPHLRTGGRPAYLFLCTSIVLGMHIVTSNGVWGAAKFERYIIQWFSNWVPRNPICLRGSAKYWWALGYFVFIVIIFTDFLW
jgi:hypothetical protein